MAILKECCTLLTDGDWIESKDQSEAGIRLIQTGNVGNGEYLDKSERAKFISEETFNRLGCTEVFPGDILVSRLPDPVGRACIIPQRDEKMITAVDCSILRTDNRIINPRYLLYFLGSPYYFNQLTTKLAGTTRVRISRKNLEMVSLRIPTKGEQEYVVNQCDHVKNLIVSRKKQLEELDTLIKARFVEMFGDPDLGRTKPDWVPISSIGTVVGGATPKTNIAEYWDGEYRWLTPAELDAASWYIYDSVRKLTEAGVRSCSLTEMPVGTVVLSSRAPIGKVAIAGNTFYCNQGFKNIICNNEVNPIFLYTLLVMNNDYLNSLGRGATFKEISKAIVENIRIPVPPYADQEVFAEFCIQVDKSKSVIQSALAKDQFLFDSLMQKYFG